MSLLSAETEALIRERAAQTGRTPDEIVREALRASPDMRIGYVFPGPVLSLEERRRRMIEISERVSALPILDHRSAEEIIGFDENGIPS